MRIAGLPRAFNYFARHWPIELSLGAQGRLRWLSCWEALMEQGLTSSQASEKLNLPRSTLYRWKGQLRLKGPQGLIEKSRRPHHTRHPTWSPQLAQAVLRLREERPRWGKDKLVWLLHQQGLEVSTSMVGRILKSLKARGTLRESIPNGVSVRKRLRPRPYAIRKPKEYQAKSPGDIVQVDTLDVRPLPGVILKHFTARDVISRWDVLEIHSRATAATAAGFLDSLQRRMPFKIRAIQVDGGSEFHADFERACQDKGIKLFVLPPHSPKLNGCVERAQRTHTEEFYEIYDGDLGLPSLNDALTQWEWTYNHIRPHQSLDWMTPLQYLIKCHPELASEAKLSNMY